MVFVTHPLLAAMSAIGPKQTSVGASHMSAFGGKADMPFCAANVRCWRKADITRQVSALGWLSASRSGRG